MHPSKSWRSTFRNLNTFHSRNFGEKNVQGGFHFTFRCKILWSKLPHKRVAPENEMVANFPYNNRHNPPAINISLCNAMGGRKHNLGGRKHNLGWSVRWTSCTSTRTARSTTQRHQRTLSRLFKGSFFIVYNNAIEKKSMYLLTIEFWIQPVEI